jgi:hypothetical protein
MGVLYNELAWLRIGTSGGIQCTRKRTCGLQKSLRRFFSNGTTRAFSSSVRWLDRRQDNCGETSPGCRMEAASFIILVVHNSGKQQRVT